MFTKKFLNNKNGWIVIVPFLILFIFISKGQGADLDLNKMFREGIPTSPFIGIVYKYVDTMLQHGRDIYGPKKSNVFLSVLDRKTLSPLKNLPKIPVGIHPENYPMMVGQPYAIANPQWDQNLLRLLYFVRNLSGDDKYAQAADLEIGWFLKNTQSKTTGLVPWGVHLCWNAITDQVESGQQELIHEFFGPWMLWDKCFELAPLESKMFARGLWENHIIDPKRGTFTSQANLKFSSSKSDISSVRHVGFFIRTWAHAYHHTRDEYFLKAINTILRRYEKKQNIQYILTESLNACQSLSLAIDCEGSARRVPEPIRSQLNRFASIADKAFCSLPHDLKAKKGFTLRSNIDSEKSNRVYTSMWDPNRDRYTTAAVAMMCVSRYENTGKIEFRPFIIAAADAYRESLPLEDHDVWPITFGHAISLELAAFRDTAQKSYYDRAFQLGEIAIDQFFDNSALPRASIKTDHYDSRTGAHTLVLALAQLHLTVLHITAVRAPVNTIDR